MLTAAKFLLLAALLLALAWWIGGLPGDVTAHVGGYAITTNTPAALLLLFLIAVIFTVMLRVLGGIGGTPGKIAAWRGAKRQAAGERAMRRGLVALAAGDAAAATAEAQKVHKLLGDTPMALMLRAEAAQLAGDTATAKSAFTALAQDKEMRFLGHRGLLRAALGRADLETAKRHAQDAEKAYPGGAWTRAQRLHLALKAQDYAAALGLTQDKNEIAALAVAAGQQAIAPRDALRYAQTALKAVPEFPPALALAAEALRRQDKTRTVRKMLLNGWAEKPHPLIAAAWFAPDATPIERAQDAAALAAANPSHAESELVLAQTALAAGLVAEARRHAGLALHAGVDDGRAQAVLDTLDNKPPAPPRSAWVCEACHNTTQSWAALCPACGKPGSLRWRTPGTALV